MNILLMAIMVVFGVAAILTVIRIVRGPSILDRAAVKRVVLCSGKVFYDLEAGRDDARDGRVAIVRVEQFYPFPATRLKEIFAAYPNAKQIFWTQEEPRNMGGWTFVEPRLREILPEGASLRFVGRSASASPATGSYAIHELEQRQIVQESLVSDSDQIAPASEPEVSERIAPASA